jgi:XTP/dITP diphosphohydrolase
MKMRLSVSTLPGRWNKSSTINKGRNMRTILLATNNPGKMAELKAILSGTGLTLVIPAELSLTLEVAEDGQTYAENATKKGLTFAHASGMVTLADDSGLEVEVLEGLPGVHSHRFCPKPDASDADRRAYLLERLQGKTRPWLAHFHATVAVAQPTGEVQLACGMCDGEIVPEEHGMNGFGYDPIFRIAGTNKTMADLEMEEKNQISHRARAVRNALPILIEVCSIEDREQREESR